MATDSNGNYYFDPNNYEDQEAYREEMEREQVRNVVKQQKKAAQEQHAVGNLWQETLQAEGIDAQTYQKLYEENPGLAKDLLKVGMQNLAQGLKKGRDSRGRFTKSETPQGRHVETRHEPDAQQRLDAIKQKAKTDVLSEAEELDIIGILFPGGL